MPKPLPPNIPLLGENLLHVLKTHEVEEKELHNMKIGVRALDELTPQEIRDLKLVFDVFDSDLDGNLSLAEVRLALRALGFKTDMDQVHKMATELNKGLVATDFNAFLNFVIDRQGDVRDLHDEIVLGFKHFDLDGTGKVTLANLKKLCRDYKVRIPDSELEEMIQEADTNGDNAVDVEEFVKVMMQTHMYS
uniref:EF-hand domain-containing protein n=3 Tax=Macrostomum lignano TaxID=282301 RepID=A0A1I8G6T3_9PLAT